jgi:hypothetical protein
VKYISTLKRKYEPPRVVTLNAESVSHWQQPKHRERLELIASGKVPDKDER